jgi:membrane protein
MKAPDSPTQLDKRSWWAVLKRTGKQFQEDNLSDWAAALTYYGIQSIFPGLLVLVSVVGLLGRSTTNAMVDNIGQLTPGPARDILRGAVDNLQHAKGAAGVLAIVGLAVALWSASGYISAFMRATNAIFDVPEGRPIWKTLPVRLGLTVVTGTLLALSVLTIVFTGRLAALVGRLIGAGSVAVRVWDIAKWPVLVVAISLMIAILYWAAPNVRHPGFRWITPGSLLATLLWLMASGGFALYVANFASYNKTYGTLGGVIAFLVWLWITNVVILLGAEFDAELDRGRAIAAGRPAEEEPYLALRDDRKVDKEAKSDLR